MNSFQFKKEFDRMYLPLCMYALRMIGIREEAEDVVQCCFASVWERIRDGEEIENLKAYMYGAVRNMSISSVRTIAKESPLAADIEQGESVSDEDIDTSERDARLWKAIGELPERCRIVFLKSKQDGLSNAVIADDLGISVKTVENQMTKAYSRLRSALGAVPPQGKKVFFLPFL